MSFAILLKEWLKTRQSIIIMFGVTVVFTMYVILEIQHAVATSGVGHIWSMMLLKDVNFVTDLKYYPLLCGIVLGVAQMWPEMQHKRLKLTLHLPYEQNRMVALMLLFGSMSLVALFGIQAGAIAMYYSTILAAEMTQRVVMTMLLWYLCGLNAYFITAAVCLEAGWRLRVLIALAGSAVTAMFFLQTASEAYNGMLWLVAIVVLMSATLSYNSIYRFKEGRQD